MLPVHMSIFFLLSSFFFLFHAIFFSLLDEQASIQVHFIPKRYTSLSAWAAGYTAYARGEKLDFLAVNNFFNYYLCVCIYMWIGDFFPHFTLFHFCRILETHISSSHRSQGYLNMMCAVIYNVLFRPIRTAHTDAVLRSHTPNASFFF